MITPSSASASSTAATTTHQNDILINPNPQIQTPIAHPHPHPHPIQPNPQPRRPRGFAAVASATDTSNTAATTTASNASGKGKREREKEKERTKLRERHRRAITSRMLAGLRQYGNFPLPARADMNDVLAALAREAGWTVESDGTTYRQSPPPTQMASFGAVRSIESPVVSGSSLKSCSVKAAAAAAAAGVLRVDESVSPASLNSGVLTEGGVAGSQKYSSSSPINSVDCLDADQECL